MAKEKTQNTLVRLFTSKDPHVVKAMQFYFEAVLYNHYQQQPIEGVSVMGVRADFCEVKDLEKSKFCPMYDEYVTAAKRKKGFWGVNLEFIIEDRRTLGGEDEL